MNRAAAFHATFTDWRLIKGRKVVAIVFEVPLELADHAYQVLGGMPDPGESTWVGIARLVNGAGVDDGLTPATREAVSSSLGQETGAPASRSNTDGATAEASREAERSNTARRPSASRSYNLAQQAAICCNDPLFQGFLAEERHYDVNSEIAAQIVRSWCNVSSRSKITPGSQAAKLWRDLHADFLLWRNNPDLVDDAARRLNDRQSERT